MCAWDNLRDFIQGYMAFCKQCPACYQVTSKIKEATQVRQHPQTFGNITHKSKRVQDLKRRRNTVHRWHCLLSNCPTQHKLGKLKIPMEMDLFQLGLSFGCPGAALFGPIAAAHHKVGMSGNSSKCIYSTIHLDSVHTMICNWCHPATCN